MMLLIPFIESHMKRDLRAFFRLAFVYIYIYIYILAYLLFVSDSNVSKGLKDSFLIIFLGGTGISLRYHFFH